MSSTIGMLKGAAEYILQKDDSTATVSHMWPKRFLKHHPQYLKQRQKPLAVNRKQSHSLETFTAYFEAYKLTRDSLGVADEDIWNMNKTGIRMGVEKAHWVITVNSKRSLHLVDPDNRESLTSVEAISGERSEIPPMLIMTGVHILEKWAVNNLSKDTLFATSKTGYSDDDLAIEWLQHFNTHSQKTQISAFWMLILDGFGSHMTCEFWDYVRQNKILLFKLSAHFTHLTQSLDVGLFQPFKHYHAEAINTAVRAGNVDFDKLNFLACFQNIQAKAFTKANIKSVWRNTGLIPYNPQVVIFKFQATQVMNWSVTPPPPFINFCSNSFHNKGAYSAWRWASKDHQKAFWRW